MPKRIEPNVGWGVKVSGPRPYLTNYFGTQFGAKVNAEGSCVCPTLKAIRVAIVPLADAVRAGLVTKKEARTK